MPGCPRICVAALLAIAALPGRVRPQEAPAPVDLVIRQAAEPRATPVPAVPPAGPLPHRTDQLPGPAIGIPLDPPAAASSPAAPAPAAPPQLLPQPAETLEEAWATAVAADQSLQARRWNVSSARESLRAARAQRWPTVAVEGSYIGRSAEPSFQFGLLPTPVPGVVPRFAQNENAAFRAAANWPLYTSGRIRYGIDAAAATLTSAVRDVDEFTMDLKLAVAGEYVTVLRAQRDVELAESTCNSLRAHARVVELLFQHEKVARNDLLAAQVSLANAQQRAIQAHNGLDVSRAAYNRRLGRQLGSPVRIAEVPVEQFPGDLAELTDGALRRRPAVARLAAEARALENQAASLRAKDRPQFQIQGEYAFEENRFRSPEGIAALGVGVSWNVFDAGRNRHEAAAVSRRAEASRRLRADLESMIALEVRRAWLDVAETRRRLEVTRQACQRADENLRVAGHRYSLGAGSNTEVLDAETLRTETYTNHHNATYDAVLAVLRLRRAIGELQ